MISFHVLEEKDIFSVLKILEPLWGKMTLKERESYFNWKYIDNPNSNLSSQFIAVDENSDKLIAFRGFFIQPYHYNNQIINIASFSDAVVHPDYRGEGIFKKLTQFGMSQINSDKDLLFLNTISNNTWPTSRGYMKLGSVALADKKILYRLSFLKSSYGKNFRFELCEKPYVTDISALLNKTKNRGVRLYCSESFLSWRYANPTMKYQFAYAWRNKDLIAFISFYKISKNRCFILDYEYTDSDAFADLIKFISSKGNIKLMQMWSISKNSEEIKLLRSLGFRTYSKLINVIKRKDEPPVLIRPAASEYDESDFFLKNLDVRKETSWNINLICSDGV